MKLATLKAGGRDGTLVVVSRDLVTCQAVPKIARTLQAALDDWDRIAPRLQAGVRTAQPGHGADRPNPSSKRNAHRRCRAPTSGPTARPTSTTSNWCARRAAPRCRPRSTPIR
jgi:hypothetical protein